MFIAVSVFSVSPDVAGSVFKNISISCAKLLQSSGDRLRIYHAVRYSDM